MKSPHVLIIPSWYRTESKPLRGYNFNFWAKTLSLRNSKVGLIFSDLLSLRKSLKIDKLKKHCFKVEENYDSGFPELILKGVNFGLFHPNFRLNFLIKTYEKLFKTYIRKFGRPDLIQAHSFLTAGVVARHLQKRFSIPYIVSEHSSFFYKTACHGELIPTPILNKYKEAYTHAKCVSAVSRPLLNWLADSLQVENKGIVLPNIIEPFLSKEKKPKSDTFVYLTLAHLNRIKRIDLLLESFRLLVDAGKKVKLIIAGDGEEKSALLNLRKQLSLENSVSFIGTLKRNQLAQFFSQGDAFILPSFVETFGNAIVEAMQYGLPIIAGAMGAPGDYINENNGLLFNGSSKEELARLMARLMTLSFNGEIIKSHAKSNFDNNNTMNLLQSIHQKALLT